MTPIGMILSLQGGYLLGSLSPSYFLGKALKNVDIRECGTGNAGTVNTYKILGLGPAIITALFDVFKGLFAMYLVSMFDAPPFVVHLVGFAAVLGHVFPFYLGFRGGQGVATATAILIYYLILFYSQEWLPWESLIILTVCAFSFAYIAKIGEVVGGVILPAIVVFVLVFSPAQNHQIFLISIIGYILFIEFLNIKNFHLLPILTAQTKSELNWRFYIRPFAILLAIYYLQSGKTNALNLIGILLTIFFLSDLTRLFSKKADVFFFQTVKSLYRSKEHKKFSSITLFLMAIFLTVLLFEQSIAILAVSFLIFGDFFSKFFGLQFGRTKIFQKTMEGSLAHFNACLIVGYILLQSLSIPVLIFLAGAFIATLVELLPLGVDDNFSVPLLSATVMSLLSLI
ncbi:MAG: glycerol-3-phosphate acyltransferase [Candidatus Aminicenantes bacterium]|jgi:glycerol-3-phosphate acyltransferase PlsY